MSVSLAAALAAVAVLEAAAPARAADLTGTWRGTVTTEGQAGEYIVVFDGEGYVLFEYTNNKGLVRTVALNATGQMQFVPPGGGVTTVAVNSVVKRPGGISYELSFGFERARNGYIDQRYAYEEHDYALTSRGLRVHVVSRAASYFGDRGGSIGGPRNAEILEGVLNRVGVE
jgi:hypothetical protein